MSRYLSVSILPMPKLSPTQIDSCASKLVKWHVKENAEISAYSLLCEIETHDLTEDASTSFAQLDIEIQEGAYIAKLLCKEGDVIKPGVPIAILCEEEEEIASAAHFDIDLKSDVYGNPDLLLVGFQAYVQLSSPSCGCS
jgi:pyruvate/2-oxoglutarate dehydrogenase complex dihydrolipoamide acyltransferase (E2) component